MQTLLHLVALSCVGAMLSISNAASAPGRNAAEMDAEPFLKKPYRGARIDTHRNSNYIDNYYQFLSRPVLKNSAVHVENKKRLKGTLDLTIFTHQPNDSQIELIESYKRSLIKAGFNILFFCPPGCLGQDSKLNWYALSEEYQPQLREAAMSLDHAGYIAAQKGRVHLDVHVGLDPGGAPPQSSLVLITEKGLDNTGIEINESFLSAAAIEQSLQQSGKVAIYAVLFEPGKADIQQGSASQLDQIALILRNNPKRKLYVVGHSDDIGDLSSNITLSENRALAVTAALNQRGVQAHRMLAKGVGPLAPVDSNKTETGRQQNRRVELVEQLD